MKSPLVKSLERIKKDRIKPKLIGEHWDEKRQVMVRVYEGVKDKPFRSIPTGYEIWDF